MPASAVPVGSRTSTFVGVPRHSPLALTESAMEVGIEIYEFGFGIMLPLDELPEPEEGAAMHEPAEHWYGHAFESQVPALHEMTLVPKQSVVPSATAEPNESPCTQSVPEPQNAPPS